MEDKIREKLEKALQKRGATLRSRQMDAAIEVLSDVLEQMVTDLLDKPLWRPA